MRLNFVKMHGAGNDYIFVDNTSGQYNILEWKDIAIKLSDRHFGIGGDGVVVMSSSSVADVKMSMFNSDGSRGLMCGNATRCIAKYIAQKNNYKEAKIKVETDAGVRICYIHMDCGQCDSVTVDMDYPIFAPRDIPLASELHIYNEYINRSIQAGNDAYTINCVSMGNPHCVIFVDDMSCIDIDRVGTIIENHAIFPSKTNVEFVSVIDRHNLHVSVWERGSGQTLACGTGACASVACAIKHNYCDIDTDVTVHLLGGKLIVRQTADTMLLRGDAVIVYNGYVEI